MFVVQPQFCTITMLTVIRLGQGIKKSEAGHQANESRVSLCFTKRFIGLLMEIKDGLFFNLITCTLKNDNYEI